MSVVLFTLLLLLQNKAIPAKTKGMTLPVIHPESPESPIFYDNVTYEQRVQRQIYQSLARDAGYFQANISSAVNSTFSNYIHPDMLGPKLGLQGQYFYTVIIGIGTFKVSPPDPPFMEYHLYMDTGSDLMWVQCEGCEDPGLECFPLEVPLYPNSVSASYHSLHCNEHSLCDPELCEKGLCTYSEFYLDETSSFGYLASENFVFADHAHVGELDAIEKSLVFGCGIHNKQYFGPKNRIAGIMGLGWSRRSIISQAISVTEGRFSYCLPVVNKYTRRWPITYLRFGRDIIIRPNLRITPLRHVKGDVIYNLVLQGLSLDQERLRVSDQAFKVKPDGSGGCVMDSGTPFSRIIKPAYAVLKNALKEHFKGWRNLKPYKGRQKLDLCYENEMLDGFKNLPSMTFHLQNADLILQPEALFVVMDKQGGGEFFCLAMLPSDSNTIIGSYQQTNYRFIYDLGKQLLFFSPDDCSHDA